MKRHLDDRSTELVKNNFAGGCKVSIMNVFSKYDILRYTLSIMTNDITRVDLVSDATVGVVSGIEMIILPATNISGRELSGFDEVRATGH